MTPNPEMKSIRWRDTHVAYGTVTRCLHWTMAGLIGWQFLGMGLRLILGRTPLVSFFVGTHQNVGTLLFLLIVLRIVWALINRRNRPTYAPGMAGRAARAGHLMLYLALAVVPAAALVRAYGSDRGFSPFGVEIFSAQQPPLAWMVTLGNALHGEIAWGMAVLILGHVVMVGVHQRMWRDATLDRMAGNRLRGAANPQTETHEE
ncbi:cytochrome b [Puniceibacterium sediminis]|uniref:Cytochrome b561 n=1 Tax=Puniceibacterium sediminis TaxID=1608407 RepID=A0A238X7U8_9RHOB|nr:cytochrome b [Puniceibacterium sediminis]SNR54651.1 cytochrome b561 [Puniceibacterium sediminis]